MRQARMSRYLTRLPTGPHTSWQHRATRLYMQAQAAENAAKSQGIGTIIGTIIGGSIGGPPGAAVGATAGSQAGGAFK